MNVADIAFYAAFTADFMVGFEYFLGLVAFECR